MGDSFIYENYYYDQYDKPQIERIDRFVPKYFYPTLLFFPIVKECPIEVAQHLTRAFAAAWSDTASAVNAMRTALEAILSDRHVPRTTVNTKKKRVPVSLHDRIKKYATKDKEAAEYLEALKWLGNIGSHDQKQAPSMANLVEGFSLFEHAIEHIYVQSAKSAKKLAKNIIVRKGKPQRPRRRKLDALMEGSKLLADS